MSRKTKQKSSNNVSLLQESEDEIQQHYQVEDILGKRQKDGVIQYKIKWVGYTKPTWQPLSNLTEITEMLFQYEQSVKKDQKKSKEKPKRISNTSRKSTALEPLKKDKEKSIQSSQVEEKSSNSERELALDLINLEEEKESLKPYKPKIITLPDGRKIKITRKYLVEIDQEELRWFEERTEGDINVDEVKSINEIKMQGDGWIVLVSFKNQKLKDKYQDRNIVRLLYPHLILQFYQKQHRVKQEKGKKQSYQFASKFQGRF